MYNNISHFYVKELFDSSHDVTWSFQYSLSGNNKTDGGFTTFLKLSSQNAELNSGGGGASLGVGSKDVINKIDNILFCVAIDSTGLFGTKATFPTGLNAPIKNSMIIRLFNDLIYLTAFPLSSVGLDGLNLNNIYNTIRINYTNIGETINIAKLNNITNEYDTFFSYTTNFSKKLNDPVQIGFSHTSPILPINLKSVLTLKDIHAQGRYVFPKYDNLFEKIYDKNGNFLYYLNPDGEILYSDSEYKEKLKEQVDLIETSE